MSEDMKKCIQCDNTFSADMFSVRVRICDYCREQNRMKREDTKKRWKLNNAEKVRGYSQKYLEKNKDEINEWKREYRQSEEGQAKIKEYHLIVYHCELCDYDIKRYKKSQHEKSANHLYFLEQSLENKKLERPDKKEMYYGKEYFCCLKCNKQELNYNWHLHLRNEEHKSKG